MPLSFEDFDLTVQNCIDYGTVAVQRAEPNKAEVWFRRGLELDSSNADLLSNLGGLLGKDADNAEARSLLWQSLILNPQLASAWSNLGIQSHRLNRFEEARFLLRMALKYKPDSPDIWMNLSTNSQYQGDWKSALAEYEEADRLRPNHAETLSSLGMLHVRNGDFDRGLPLYEARHAMNRPFPSEQIPKWTGERLDLDGKKVLLLGEQGVGDHVMGARYGAALREAFPKIGQVNLFCQDHVRPLLELWPGFDNVYSPSDGVIPGHDWQIAVLSMLRFMRLHGHPMIPPVVKPRRLSKRPCAGFSPYLHVGLAWRGNVSHVNNRYRSFPFHFVEDLVKEFHDAAHFTSLQYPIEEAERIPDLYCPEGKQGWHDTVKLIEDLDLVIACDTAVGHLAASIGVPVWMGHAANGDWRWGCEGDKTEWYPCMNIYRMPKLPDWTPVFEEVKTALRGLASG